VNPLVVGSNPTGPISDAVENSQWVSGHRLRELNVRRKRSSSSSASILQYFSRNRQSLDERQIRALGVWISEAVTADGDLENAVSTCFLEHAGQVGVNRLLRPFLSAQAKAKLHA